MGAVVSNDRDMYQCSFTSTEKVEFIVSQSLTRVQINT